MEKEPDSFTQGLAARVRGFCNEPRELDQIAAHLKREPTDAFRDWLESLAFNGELIREKGELYLAFKGRAAVGTFRRAKGYGRARAFVVPLERDLSTIDVMTGAEEGAQDGDRVLVSYRREGDQRGKKRRPGAAESLSGRILSVIDQRRTEAVGIVEVSRSGQALVRLEGYNLPTTAVMSERDAYEFEDGAVVRVKLLRKPDSRGRARVEVLEEVGFIADPEHDLDNLCALYGFPGDFDKDALAEADALPEDPDPSQFAGRVDLRKLTVLTIDPRDAEDHDDAISLEKLKGGMTRLGVHIADVSAYVTPGSSLDRDARDRATSVYLPGLLIPMLPQKLSGGLCSLHEGVDRLAKTCFMTFDSSGKEVRREIVDSVVRVKRFFTYEEVLPVLESDASCGDKKLDSLLRDARKLADKLLKRRIKRGALVLEIPRPHVYVNNRGEATHVEPESHDIAHGLIEEFMLAANEAVAGFLIERSLPIICRIHPLPGVRAQEEFVEFCEELKLPTPDFDKPGGLQRFLEQVRSREDFESIHYALLRTMQRAVYSPRPGLHFALGTRRYLHFTSPIRRYPDTLVHQVLSAFIATGRTLRWESGPLEHPWADGSSGGTGGTGPKLSRAEAEVFEEFEFQLPHIAAHSTERSIRSDRGELAADQIKILRMLLPSLGDTAVGTVVVVAGRHLVLRLEESMAEGQLAFRDLTDGWVEPRKFWAHIETAAGARMIPLGEKFEVELTEIDLSSRTLKLEPVEGKLLEHGRRRSPGRRQGPRKRRR